MSELEDLIRAKAKSGGLHGVTLFESNGRWQGNVRYNSDGWRVEVRDDPIEALLAALRSDVHYGAVETKRATPAAAPLPTGGLFD